MPSSVKFTNAMRVRTILGRFALIMALFAIHKTALIWLEKPIDKEIEKVKQLIQ